MSLRPISALTVLLLPLAACADRIASPRASSVPGPSLSVVASPPTTFYLGDVVLTSNGSLDAGFAPQVWSIQSCDMSLSARVDVTGESDAANAHAWSQLGVRQVGYDNFNPTWQVEGAGVWLGTDYDYTPGTFAPDPAGAPVLDIDDKLLLGKAGGHGEADYNLPSVPPAPGNNHRFWFDRDGVDPWQAAAPLAVNGGTYNTQGLYDVALALHGTDATHGTAYLTINGLAQGFETDGNWNTMELSPAGMTFTGDMNAMQVFYGLYGYGATHTVSFKDVTVTGCLVLNAGMATGGGWFIPEVSKAQGLTLDGSKAVFGFNAKQKDGVSSGNLNFQYSTDGLHLVATAYDWVTVAAGQVMFEGTGTINGEGTYRFRVRAVDGAQTGGADRFEIRVWTSGGSFDDPTYRAEGDLGGGSIVVHK